MIPLKWLFILQFNAKKVIGLFWFEILYFDHTGNYVLKRFLKAVSRNRISQAFNVFDQFYNEIKELIGSFFSLIRFKDFVGTLKE